MNYVVTCHLKSSSSLFKDINIDTLSVVIEQTDIFFKTLYACAYVYEYIWTSTIFFYVKE